MRRSKGISGNLAEKARLGSEKGLRDTAEALKELIEILFKNGILESSDRKLLLDMIPSIEGC
jgi:hypothetical protein